MEKIKELLSKNRGEKVLDTGVKTIIKDNRVIVI